jgi:hypothetical protein
MLFDDCAGTHGALTATPNNTLIIAGDDAIFQCSSSASTGPNAIAWSQTSTVSLGCKNFRPEYNITCPPGGYNQLHVLKPSTPNTYYCSDSPSTVAKAAVVILSKHVSNV